MYDKSKVTRFKSKNKVNHNQPPKKWQPRRKRIEPQPAKPCQIVNAYGMPKFCDDHEVLHDVTDPNQATTFPSRTQARSAIYVTTQLLKKQGYEYHIPVDFRIVEV